MKKLHFKFLKIKMGQNLEEEINFFCHNHEVRDIRVEKTGYSQEFTHEVYITYLKQM